MVFASHVQLDVRSAGTNHDADVPLSGDLIEWADVIMAMEGIHRRRLAERYSRLLRGKRVIVLDIPDNYDYMDPQLVAVLQRRIPHLLNLEKT